MRMCDERKARENLVSNLRYIMHKENIRQNALAERLGIAPASMVRILRSEQTPTVYPFFANVAKEFGYSVEELLNMNIQNVEMIGIDSENIVDDTQKRKFYGIYQLYYFSTEAFKGRENKEAKEALSYGLLLIYKDRKDGKYSCKAEFGLSRDEMLIKFSNCNKKDKNGFMDNALTYLESFHTFRPYIGNLEMSNNHAYISLAYGDKDRVHVILHRPDSTSDRYIGGAGAMVSVSKGRESCPCLQVLGISRYNLDVSEEEIARRLLLGYPTIKPGDKCEVLINMIKKMYQQPEQETVSMPGFVNFDLNLTDVHKEYIIRGEITKIITDIIENNLFRTFKISLQNDDEWYHFVKKFDPKKR